MNILEFIKKYEYTKVFNGEYSKEFKNDLNLLLINSKSNETLVLTFHTLLENYFPFEILKDVINYDEKGKEEIFTLIHLILLFLLILVTLVKVLVVCLM